MNDEASRTLPMCKKRFSLTPILFLLRVTLYATAVGTAIVCELATIFFLGNIATATAPSKATLTNVIKPT